MGRGQPWSGSHQPTVKSVREPHYPPPSPDNKLSVRNLTIPVVCFRIKWQFECPTLNRSQSKRLQTELSPPCLPFFFKGMSPRAISPSLPRFLQRNLRHQSVPSFLRLSHHYKRTPVTPDQVEEVFLYFQISVMLYFLYCCARKLKTNSFSSRKNYERYPKKPLCLYTIFMFWVGGKWVPDVLEILFILLPMRTARTSECKGKDKWEISVRKSSWASVVSSPISG